MLPSNVNTTAPADYDPFGTPSSMLGLQHAYRSEVMQLDLIHLRNRDYQPTTGSFTTPDPLAGIAGTTTETNPYHYADNDPTNKTDPLGLSPQDPDISPAGVCVTGLVLAASDGPIPLGDAIGAGLCVSAITLALLMQTGVIEAPHLDLPDINLPHPNPHPGPEPKPKEEEPRPPVDVPTPQPGPRCDDGRNECQSNVVIGESTYRTRAAAAAFGAEYWPGVQDRGASHSTVCAANEAWLRGEISRGKGVIDIGIDSGRTGSRSPYYELEQRIVAETGTVVQKRHWASSNEPYEPADLGPCP